MLPFKTLLNQKCGRYRRFSESISVYFCESLYCLWASHFRRKTANKNKQNLKKQKHWVLIHTWSNKAFEGTVVNRALPSLHGGSLEITLTVTLKWGKRNFSMKMSNESWCQMFLFLLCLIHLKFHIFAARFSKLDIFHWCINFLLTIIKKLNIRIDGSRFKLLLCWQNTPFFLMNALHF